MVYYNLGNSGLALIKCWGLMVRQINSTTYGWIFCALYIYIQGGLYNNHITFCSFLDFYQIDETKKIFEVKF